MLAKPPPGFVKINGDVAFATSSSLTGLSVAVRDEEGSMVEGLACKKRVSSTLVGEALALREACRLVSSRKSLESGARYF